MERLSLWLAIVKWTLIVLGVGVIVFTCLSSLRFKKALEVREWYRSDAPVLPAWEALSTRLWGRTPPSVFALELDSFSFARDEFNLEQASLLKGWPINRTRRISVNMIAWQPDFAEVLRELDRMPKLQTWSGSGAKFNRKTLAMLAEQAPNLTSLTLSNNDLAVDDYLILTKFQNVESMRLNLYNANLTLEILAILASINHRSDSVAWGLNQLDDSIAPHLASYKHLSRLSLFRNDITHKCFESIDLDQLSYLNVSETKVDPDIWFKQADVMANLTELHLGRLPLTDAGVSDLVRVAPNLIKLNISSTMITNSCCKDLILLPYLERLNVNATNLSQSALTTLKSKPGLKVQF